MSNTTVVILAAGHGKRMKSNLIKVMHPLAGKPMIGHVVDNARRAGFNDIVVVVGFQQERLRAYLGDSVKYAVQTEQLGTGHAMLQAEPFIDAKPDGDVFVMLGDNPFLKAETIHRLFKQHHESGASATLLTARVSDPTGLGRIIRDSATGQYLGTVEEKDATPEQKKIQEIWPGVAVFRRQGLVDVLKRLDNNNAQREYYLPQTFEILSRDGRRVEAALEASEAEAIAPNDRVKWAEAEARIRWDILERHMLEGVTIIDPRSTFIDEDVQIGQDTVIWPNTFIHGHTVIGTDCVIGPGSTVVSCRIADKVKIHQSVVEQSAIGPGCVIGPMAHLRPGCDLEGDVEIGNYAELKKAKVGRGVKCHHHSYMGDVTIGERANIGAGAITANYNGYEKFATTIGVQAFVGTNVNLIAPITIGDGALVAAGSSIGRSVPPDALAVERAEPIVKEGGAARLKARYRARKEAKSREGV
ncbi:MAG TPA: bifunctional UDP-N-acetylglucosamine diphosphorylase/glucosamine-1-phosphate N-acetyltransferase GlmU [Symbiobacteriaceae bacterium]|jgi:bifunctional UDP-N-acetylglucosamine pyrophosphorylase/glucosamine-1-phosphate N-acetyltransferase